MLQPFADVWAARCPGLSHQLVSSGDEVIWRKHVELTDDLVQLAANHLHSHPRLDLTWLSSGDASRGC